VERKNDRDAAAKLDRALHRMPRLRREIFLAARLDGMDLAEIAKRTGVSVRRAERELARALVALDRELHATHRRSLRQLGGFFRSR
jgi:RNA polymerase sigma-70 factor (ECF subfamily)